MASWWEYYKLKEEPYLSTDPLKSSKELQLFWGRKEEIRKFNRMLQGRNSRAVLLTGFPGVGKTTLLFKLFSENKGFVHINLSEISRIGDAEILIDYSFIKAIANINKTKAKELKHKLENSVSETIGQQQSGGVSSVVKIESGSSSSTSFQKVKNLEIISLVKECADYIHSQKFKILAVIDETDFFDNDSKDEIVRLTQRLKLKLPPNSVLIMVNRDIDKMYSDQFKDVASIIRTTFKNHINLTPVWNVGIDSIQKFLRPRLRIGKPQKGFVFPLDEKACRVLDLLCDGNYKLLLQYLEHVLIEGAEKKSKLPLSATFVKRNIFAEFSETVIDDPEVLNILKLLRKKPAHARDKEFIKQIKGLKGTAIYNKMAEMEVRRLVFKKTQKTGVAQPYYITDKGLLYL